MAGSKRPKLTNDWDNERKKARLLGLLSAAVGVFVIVLAIILTVRGH